MSFFVQLQIVNHGLDKTDIGKVFTFREGKFFPITSEEIESNLYMDWTIISDVIDADNLEGFSGEDAVLELAHNIHKKYEKPPCILCGSSDYEGDLVQSAQRTRAFNNDECKLKFFSGKSIQEMISPLHKTIIKYRFSDDPIDMVREYESTPTWDEKAKAFCLIPADAFPGKSIILI